MSQYDIHISEFLSRNKFVSFEKIGHLSYYSNTATPDQPAATGPLHFTFDKKAVTTKELIDYITERTGKSRTLIESDIESYFELMRQIVNIGNPHEIEGTGIFRLAKSGEFEFSLPDLTVKKDDHRTAKKHQSLSGTSFQPAKRGSRSAVMLLAVLIVIGVLAVIGWGAYTFFTSESNLLKNADTAEQVTAMPPTDTMPGSRNNTITDSGAIKPANTTDTTGFRFIHEITPWSVRAVSRTAKLASYGYPAAYDSLDTDTGRIYRLYIQLKAIPADTARIKDSLQKSLQRSISIENEE